MASQKISIKKQFSLKILLEQLELLQVAQSAGAKNLTENFQHSQMCERLKNRMIRKKLKRVKVAENLKLLFKEYNQ